MDNSNSENNVILTKTKFLTMGKPSALEFACNKNILVIGGLDKTPYSLWTA